MLANRAGTARVPNACFSETEIENESGSGFWEGRGRGTTEQSSISGASKNPAQKIRGPLEIRARRRAECYPREYAFTLRDGWPS